jgi:mono/diheme cytochrome c family protein
MCAIAAMAVSTAAYFGLGFADVAADRPPSGLERAVMSSAVAASVRRQAGAAPRPAPCPESCVIAGGKLFLNDCVGCHGGIGGPPSEFGETFFPPAPQFARVGSRFSESELLWVASHGIRMTGMYPQAPGYSDEQLESIVSFIARIRNLPPGVVRALEPGGSR